MVFLREKFLPPTFLLQFRLMGIRMRVMLNYKLPYHVIQEKDEDTYLPKLSFKTLEEAKEFIKFAPNPNLIISTH